MMNKVIYKTMFYLAVSFSLGALLTACGMGVYPENSLSQTDYVLGAGDVVKVKVLGDSTLDGEYRVGHNGAITLPMVGDIDVSTLSLKQFQGELWKQLDTRFLKNPDVSAEIVSYRDIYIIGEVNVPGNYAYVPNMSGLQAVALAGGFKAGAQSDSIEIRRKQDEVEKSIPAPITQIIKPGDTLIVKRRWF